MPMRRLMSALAAVGTILVSAGALAEEPATPAAVRSFEFNYSFKVKDIPADAGSVMVWVPLPPTNEWQQIGDWSVMGDAPHTVVKETLYGNSFLRLDLSNVDPAADGTRGTTISFNVTRKARRPLETKDGGSAPSPQLMERFLAPDSKITLEGEVAAEALATTAGANDPIEAGRRIYDHLVDTMKYDKPADKKGWGQGDAAWACDNRFGNCTDFHSLFIGQARSIDIPARFIMGFPLPADKTEGEVGGYHCWAEFWADGYGWLPIDASEANKHPEQRELLFGGLDAHRVQFSMGRDIELPGAQSGPVNYIVYPHVEVDGKKHDSFDKSFSFKDK
jgi:hypothetical protein